MKRETVGKGNHGLANALRALKAKSPEIKIMVIDPKADPKEKAYWRH
jgi:hypothetical protein